MSDKKQVRFMVFNQRNQPVELHYGTHTTVLAPQGSIELSEAELRWPQVQALVARRYLVVHEVPRTSRAVEARPVADAPRPKKPGGKTAK